MSRTLSLLALSLLATGCGYKRTMNLADQYEAREDWRAALQAYEEASDRRPRSEEAREGARRTRPKAVEDAVVAAREAVASGRYEDAVTLADWARAELPREPLVADAYRWIEAEMRADLDAALAGRRTDDAADLALRMRALFPRADLAATFAGLRRHYADRAQDAERVGQLGPAAALYARAVELVDHPDDRAAMRRLVDELRAQSTVTVHVAHRGEGWRTVALRRAVDPMLADVPGVLVDVDPRGADLSVDVDTSGARCAQQATVQVVEHPYVAGQREVRNPAYDAAMERLHVARQHLTGLLDDEQARRDALTQARAHADVYEAEVLKPRTDAWEEARATVARIEAALAGPRAGDVDLIRALEVHRAVLAAAELARDEAVAELAARRELVAEARAHLDALAPELQAAQARVQRLDAERHALPATLLEDVVVVHRYDVADWTRTCTTDVVVSMRTDTSARPQVRRYQESASTTDTAWAAFPQLGIAGDPLTFAYTDGELILAADRAAAAGVVSAVREQVAAGRSAEVDRALVRLGTDPNATTVLLALWLTDPDTLPASEREAVAAHLERAYGLDRLDTLRG